MKRIIEQIKTLGTFISVGVGYHVIDRGLNMKNDKEADARMDRMEQKLDTVASNQESHQSEMRNKFSELNEYANKNLYDNKGEVKEVVSKDVSESLTEHLKGFKESLIKHITEAKNGGLAKQAQLENWQKALEKVNEIDDYLTKDKDKFLSGLSNFFEYLDTLTLLQESSLFHVAVFIVIVLSLINIISVLFANEFINYFNLEKRFPKLAIFFKLRLKWQKFYLIMNFTILFIMCIFAIAINILLFII
jgi:hypothetical protein